MSDYPAGQHPHTVVRVKFAGGSYGMESPIIIHDEINGTYLAGSLMVFSAKQDDEDVQIFDRIFGGLPSSRVELPYPGGMELPPAIRAMLEGLPLDFPEEADWDGDADVS